MGQSRAFFAKMCRGKGSLCRVRPCTAPTQPRPGREQGSTAGKGQRQSLQGASQAAGDRALKDLTSYWACLPNQQSVRHKEGKLPSERTRLQ